MAERQIVLCCAYCQKETKLIVKESRPMATQSQPTAVVKYCAHCRRANKLELPDNLDVHLFILGQDKGFLRYQQGNIPLLQGEKEL